MNTNKKKRFQMDFLNDFVFKDKTVLMEGGNIAPFYVDDTLNRLYGTDGEVILEKVKEFITKITPKIDEELRKSSLMYRMARKAVNSSGEKSVEINVDAKIIEKNGFFISFELGNNKISAYPVQRLFNYELFDDGTRNSKFELVFEAEVESPFTRGFGLILLQVEKKLGDEVGFDMRFGISKKGLDIPTPTPKFLSKIPLFNVEKFLTNVLEATVSVVCEEIANHLIKVAELQIAQEKEDNQE